LDGARLRHVEEGQGRDNQDNYDQRGDYGGADSDLRVGEDKTEA
jgi:hypothetical protein